MNRIRLLFCLMLCAGCSRTPETNPAAERSRGEVEDGGTVENADRDRVEEYFAVLGQVQSADEEKKLLTEFGAWLKENGYKIRVEVKHGEYGLSCPHFPPVTPWAEHTFFDVKNLELLPRAEDDG